MTASICRYPGALLSGFVIGLMILPSSQAQIRTDVSLGKAAQSLSGPSFMIPESLGKLAGSNLFHSFQTFNIGTGENATFTTSSSGISNVISRVTGGAESTINGPMSLTAASGAPSFFFINPAGITFGAGASIDVPGAFHVSTADYVKFPDGNFYVDSAKVSTFSSANPEAFGFLGNTRGPTDLIDGARLISSIGNDVSVIAADITIKGGSLLATEGGGTIRIQAVGQDAVEIPMSGQAPTHHGTLQILTGGSIRSVAQTSDGGSVTIGAGDVSINGGGIGGLTGIVVTTADSGNAGEIRIEATNSVSLVNGGTLSSHTESSGNGGAILVVTGTLVTDRQGDSNSDDGAGSGDIHNFHTGLITTGDGNGRGGSVAIHARVVRIGDNNPCDEKGCINSGFGSYASDEGRGGDIRIDAERTISVLGTGIDSRSDFYGDAGNIALSADDIEIRTTGSGAGLSSLALSRGNAGQVTINARTFLLNGAFINTTTYSDGNAGNINIKADAMMVSDSNIYSDTEQPLFDVKAGDAGNVTIAVARDLVVERGFISSSTLLSPGNGGRVSVSARNMQIKNALIQTDVEGNDFDSQYTKLVSGQGGELIVTATENLTLEQGGVISSSTAGPGAAGTATVSASNMLISGGGYYGRSGIYSRSGVNSHFDPADWYKNFGVWIDNISGNGGSVVVNASGDIRLSDGGQISSSTATQGNAGTVQISAKKIMVDGIIGDPFSGKSIWSFGHPDILFSGISTTAEIGSTGKAGAVNIHVTGTLDILNAGVVSSETYGVGNAGTVTVTAGNATIDGSVSGSPSRISASAKFGSSGQTGSVSVSASNGLAVQNGGEIAIRNDATVVRPESLKATLLTVTAPAVILKDASITAESTGNVAASNIVVNATDRLYLDPSHITTSAKDGNGGSITINGGKLVQMDNSQITTSVAGIMGNGGNIKISADLLLMQTGFVQANTAAANAVGGDVDINVKSLLPSGNTLFLGGSSPYTFQPYVFGYNIIQAAAPTGVSGTVTTSVPALDISGSLVGLRVNIMDPGGMGRKPCQTAFGSSLGSTGHGGLPPSARGPMRLDSTEQRAESAVLVLTPPPLLAALTPCTAL